MPCLIHASQNTHSHSCWECRLANPAAPVTSMSTQHAQAARAALRGTTEGEPS